MDRDMYREETIPLSGHLLSINRVLIAQFARGTTLAISLNKCINLRPIGDSQGHEPLNYRAPQVAKYATEIVRCIFIERFFLLQSLLQYGS